MVIMKKSVLIIGGPTASGKSGLAMAVAEALNGVIINADSMQIYQGLPILTAQPSSADIAKAPHRLYAALPPTDVCSVARWRDLALAEIRAAQAEGKLPVIVGGTGFYLKTLLQGISPIPAIPPEFRAEAAALQQKLGNPGFHQELAKRDPLTAAKLDPLNTQRLVRAFEVLLATGKSLAEWQSLPRTGTPDDLHFLTVILQPPRELLYAACDGRFSQMLKTGALEEAKKFNTQFPAPSSLSKALGYPELLACLAGKATLAEASTLAQQSTRNYAKRQTTWFRHQITADMVLHTPDPAPLLSRLKTGF
jgi:tRNA dimethylallyltransferase